MRPIDADALKKSIDECDICNICPDKDVRCDYDCDFPDFLSPKWEALIDAQPTIEPKQGTYRDSGEDDEWYGHWAICNECGAEWMGDENFCPNCGARMKGADRKTESRTEQFGNSEQLRTHNRRWCNLCKISRLR